MKLKKILSCAALCVLPLSGVFAQGDAEGQSMTHDKFKEEVYKFAKDFEKQSGGFVAFCYNDKINNEVMTNRVELASFLKDSESVIVKESGLTTEDSSYYIKNNNSISLGKVIDRMKSPGVYGCSMIGHPTLARSIAAACQAST